MKHRRKNTKKTSSPIHNIIIPFGLFAKMMHCFEVGRVDFGNPERVKEFRRNVSYEQMDFLDSCRRGEYVPAEQIGFYLSQRFTMLDCPVTRSLYKIGMVYALEDAFGVSGAVGVMRRALNHLRLKLNDTQLLGYCSLVVVKFADESDLTTVVIDVCESGARKATESGEEVHCLPELYRMWAKALDDTDQASKALDIVRMAEAAATRQAYYMPALWNRIHRTKSRILRKLSDEKGAAECLSMIKLNGLTYCGVENSDDVADDRLRWMDRKPPGVRPVVY
jgi:hypothetical protein